MWGGVGLGRVRCGVDWRSTLSYFRKKSVNLTKNIGYLECKGLLEVVLLPYKYNSFSFSRFVISCASVKYIQY